jgi:uncharacterized protein
VLLIPPPGSLVIAIPTSIDRCISGCGNGRAARNLAVAGSPNRIKEMTTGWQERAVKSKQENFAFLQGVKYRNAEEVDRLARRLYEEASSILDCSRCANCCKTVGPKFTLGDIARIAAHLGISEGAFSDQYLQRDDYGLERGLVAKALPCPFLGEDDHCTIYAVRPLACRQFPHANKRLFASRINLHLQNTLRCPTVFYIVERMKTILRDGSDPPGT